MKIPEGVDIKKVLKHMHKVGWLRTAFYYMIDWKTRKNVNLQNWINTNIDIPVEAYIDLKYIKNYKSNHRKIKEILKYVHRKIKYKSDIAVWDVKEKWQTPSETWDLKTGDCEDGALLAYAIAVIMGIPDYQLYIVAGDVLEPYTKKEVGHCYLIFISDEDLKWYPIDWCYYYSSSISMNTTYYDNINYFNGKEEWLRFNNSGAYKLWRK